MANLPDEVIVLDDDEFSEDGDAFNKRRRELEEMVSSRHARRVGFNMAVDKDADDDDDELDDQKHEQLLLNQGIEFVDLTSDEPLPRRREFVVSGQDEEVLETYTTSSEITIDIGTVVELAHHFGRCKATFVQVTAVVKNALTDQVLVRGFLYARSCRLRGVLPQKLNEVCMIIETIDSDERPWRAQALVDVDISENPVIAIRQLRITNASFPEFRYDAVEYAGKTMADISESAVLVCRHRMFYSYRNASQKTAKRAYEWAIVRFREDEAEPKWRVTSEALVNQWRGRRTFGGSHVPGRSAPIIDVEAAPPGADEHASRTLVPGQRYSAADAFCGAGGASRGMERAGIQVAFAVDHCHHAAQSYRANFAQTELHHRDIDEFVHDTSVKKHVDFLHLSPPCQVWSPAHTVAGKNDEANVAALFSCEHLIQKCKPRIFTLEQTFGILRQGFEEFFNVLIWGFTRHGYSVRWKILHLLEYGLAQPRRRLIIIGAGPGEKLPPFPAPTHGNNGPLPVVTAYDVLRDVDRYPPHPLHNPAEMIEKAAEKTWPRWDPHQPLRWTLTCSGGESYHWSGVRKFTNLEMALLQGFPRWHKFRGKRVLKQIGNAFPPSVVRVLYEYLAKCLDDHDGIRGCRVLCDVPDNGVITFLSSDDDDDDDDDGGDVPSLPSPPTPPTPVTPFPPQTPQTPHPRHASLIDLTNEKVCGGFRRIELISDDEEDGKDDKNDKVDSKDEA